MNRPFSDVDYSELEKRLDALISDSPAAVSALANSSALIFEHIPDVSWAGFYVRRGEELILGPFQGKTACIVIPRGRGVCQAALREGKTVVVDDVTAFPGHIACDARSRSEIVVPVKYRGEVVAVLDIDSYSPGRFSGADAPGLEKLVGVVEKTVGDRISGLV